MPDRQRESRIDIAFMALSFADSRNLPQFEVNAAIPLG